MSKVWQSPHTPPRRPRGAYRNDCQAPSTSECSASSRTLHHPDYFRGRAHSEVSKHSPTEWCLFPSSPDASQSHHSSLRTANSPSRSPTALDFLREQRLTHNRASPRRHVLSRPAPSSRSPITSAIGSKVHVSPSSSPEVCESICQEPAIFKERQSRKCADPAKSKASVATDTCEQSVDATLDQARSLARHTDSDDGSTAAADPNETQQLLMDVTPPDFGQMSDDDGPKPRKMAKTDACSSPEARLSSSLDAATRDKDDLDPVLESTETLDSSQNVVVCVRMRHVPHIAGPSVWQLEQEANCIAPTRHHPTMAKRTTPASEAAAASCGDGGAYNFRFDALVSPEQSADEMYTTRIAPIVAGVIKGYNGTVFAYGQTGSGKTYTMSGGGTEEGVIPRAIQQVFASVEKDASREFLLRVSYMEIYNENLHDLLADLPASPSLDSASDTVVKLSSPIKGGSSHVVVGGGAPSASLRMFESGGRVQISGLREEIVTNASEVLSLLERGQQARHQAATDWNERSSRSHCVFILTLESRTKAPTSDETSNHVQVSQLNLIDLAGSERAASEKARRKEGSFINKSLLTLGTVIAKLSEQCAAGKTDGRHIPYRDSKLTRLLQTSLGGNARVAVVCTLSPRKEHAVESLSTLRFGQRCKMVVTQAKQGTIMDDKALIARYRQELEKLRMQLANASDAQSTEKSTSSKTALPDDFVRELQSERVKAEDEMRDMNEKRAELKKQVEHLTRLILTGKTVVSEVEKRNSQEQVDYDLTSDDSDSEAAKDPMITKMEHIRKSRRSDFGPPSPIRKARKLLHVQGRPTPLRFNISENTACLSEKPFTLETELFKVRKELAEALDSIKKMEKDRANEQCQMQAKISQLQVAKSVQDKELLEAQLARDTLSAERDRERARADKIDEFNCQLEVTMKRYADTEAEGHSRQQKHQQNLVRLESELAASVKEKREASEANKERVEALEMQIASLKQIVINTSENSAAQEKIEIQRLQEALDLSEQEKANTAQALVAAQEAAAKSLSQTTKAHVEEMARLQKELGDVNAARDAISAELKAKIQIQSAEAAQLGPIDDEKGAETDAELAKLRHEVQFLKEQLSEQDVHISAEKQTPSLPRISSPSRRNLLRRVMEDEEAISDSSADGSVTMLHPGPFSGNKALYRGGSLRDYKRSSICLDGEVNLSALDMGKGDSVMLQLALKEKHEEIQRLNEIVSAQRSIMSELETSVAEWKKRLRSQHEIIEQLVGTKGDIQTTKAFDTKPEENSTSTELVMSQERSNVSDKDLSLPASTSIQSTTQLRHSGTSSSSLNLPYYGAHLYNRPPPFSSSLSIAESGRVHDSPSKGLSSAPVLLHPRPEPPSLHESATNVSLVSSSLSASPSRVRRRKTIEAEIELLKGSPRVEHTKHRLLEPITMNQSSSIASVSSVSSPLTSKPSAVQSQWKSMAGTGQSGQSRSPLPSVPGSPLRASREYYI